MKVTILIFCLHDLFYVNIKHEKLGEDWNCPTSKIGSQLLRGRMDKVMNNFFNNLKLVLFLVLKANSWWNFWIPLPKKYKNENFHEDWPYRTQVMTISLDTDNSKWRISEEKTLKLHKFQKPISQEPFRFRWKNLLTYFSY